MLHFDALSNYHTINEHIFHAPSLAYHEHFSKSKSIQHGKMEHNKMCHLLLHILLEYAFTRHDVGHIYLYSLPILSNLRVNVSSYKFL